MRVIRMVPHAALMSLIGQQLCSVQRHQRRSMSAASSRKAMHSYRPGEIAPVTGIYTVQHQEHRPEHTAVLNRVSIKEPPPLLLLYETRFSTNGYIIATSRFQGPCWRDRRAGSGPKGCF
jgi:hypothetical protein